MALPCQNPAPDLIKPDGDELRLRVDRFRKLGYSTKDVEETLRKLHLDSDTNTVLGELVRLGARSAPTVSNAENEERSTWSKTSLMPPSWTSMSPRSKPEAAQKKKKKTEDELRMIVIDGSNVAMSHGNEAIFSCRGIQLAVNFFLDRGHDEIKVFVPRWRKEKSRPIRDRHILTELENRQILVFTPSRYVEGKLVTCYDDRYIVKEASDEEGVIVSNDTYRDLLRENAEWKKCIEERLLMYSFVNDKFMPPDDPLGRNGPTLDNFLKKKPLPTEPKRELCPYGKKCTYGIKCKYDHPERTNQSYKAVADELREKAQISSNEPKAKSSPKCSVQKSDSLKSFQVSENVLLYKDAQESSQNHIQLSGEHRQSEWAGQHPLMPSHHYGNGSQEYLDSGLGSYDSFNNSLWSWPQQQGQASDGSRQNNMSQSSPCPPFVLPASPALHPASSMEELKYIHYAFPHKGSFTVQLQYSSAPPLEQNYWSDPYPAVPQARTSLPVPHHNHPYSGPQYNHWAQSPSFGTSDIRTETRNRLLAVFHPEYVDRAMKMFPSLTDPEKLAAEIVKLIQRKIIS